MSRIRQCLHHGVIGNRHPGHPPFVRPFYDIPHGGYTVGIAHLGMDMQLASLFGCLIRARPFG